MLHSDGWTDIGRASTLAAIFKLRGDPTRLRIVMSCLDAPKFVGDIALELELPQSLVSQHLRLLRSARLMIGVRTAKRLFYVNFRQSHQDGAGANA